MATPMLAVADLLDKRFGRLVIIDVLPHVPYRKKRVVCRCDCGKTKTIQWSNLRNGSTISCGCARSIAGERTRTHGLSANRIYKLWSGMWSRCAQPNDKSFQDYGGRGIRVCDRWRSVDAFYKDMGDKPRGKSLGRIDNDGPYSPENCRWETPSQQNRNKRTTVILEVDGDRRSVAEWSEITGLAIGTILKRIKEGWSVRDSVCLPLRTYLRFRGRPRRQAQ